MSKIYDVIVLGAGPAGLAAGLYAGRSRLSVLIVEKGQDGGQISITDEIENYPGQVVDQPESGPSLIARMTEQAKKFGAERVSDTIKEVSLEGEVKVLKGEKGEYQAKNIIIATGAHARPIGCKGEAEFLGRGVSYCAVCDGPFFKEKTAAVVGGGSAALQDALYLEGICSKVYLIHRRDTFRAEKSLIDQVMAAENIECVMESRVTTLIGEKKLTELEVTNLSGEKKTLVADGLFVAIGMEPHNEVFRDLVDLDEAGYVIAGENCKTRTPGVYAAGDCRTKTVRQLTTAAADGTVCGLVCKAV